MPSREFFEPSFYGFVSYFFNFCLRYFAAAGSLYLFFNVVFRKRWLGYRIQQAFPSRSHLFYEIRWSMLNAVCTGLCTVLVYKLIHDDYTSMYYGLMDRGWAYLGFSAFLVVLGHDTWIYWQHRLLHTPWMFRHVHSAHHHLNNPSPLAAFAQHPVETLMGNVYFILFIVFVPLHPFALAAAGLYMFIFGINGHLGYEFYPRGFTRHSILGWISTSTHHNMHHRHVGCNYGNWFNWWDWVMGTNHPAYHDTFDAVPRRRLLRTGLPSEIGSDDRVAVSRAA